MTVLALKIGEPVFLSSGGVGRVKTFATRTPSGQPSAWTPTAADPPYFYVIETTDKVACIPISKANETLRRLVNPDEAQRMLETLRGEAPPLSLKPILERGKDVAHSGSPHAHALFLRELYSLPQSSRRAWPRDWRSSSSWCFLKLKRVRTCPQVPARRNDSGLSVSFWFATTLAALYVLVVVGLHRLNIWRMRASPAGLPPCSGWIGTLCWKGCFLLQPVRLARIGRCQGAVPLRESCARASFPNFRRNKKR